MRSFHDDTSCLWPFRAILPCQEIPYMKLLSFPDLRQRHRYLA